MRRYAECNVWLCPKCISSGVHWSTFEPCHLEMKRKYLYSFNNKFTQKKNTIFKHLKSDWLSLSLPSTVHHQFIYSHIVMFLKCLIYWSIYQRIGWKSVCVCLSVTVLLSLSICLKNTTTTTNKQQAFTHSLLCALFFQYIYMDFIHLNNDELFQLLFSIHIWAHTQYDRRSLFLFYFVLFFCWW